MAVNNTLVRKEQNTTPATVGQYLGQEKIKKWINGMIGSEKEAQKFISSIISATATNPALQACEYARKRNSPNTANRGFSKRKNK